MLTGSHNRWLRSISLALAAVLAGTFAGTAPAHADLRESTFSGTLAPGASRTYVWSNLSPNTAFEVGLSPIGASTSTACTFEVTDQWYERLSNGQRRFHATIKNIGSLACGTQVLLSAIGSSTIQATGGMEPGEIKTFSRYLNPSRGTLAAAPLLALSPSGATSANPCQFKVRRTWFQRVRQGDVQQPVLLHYEVQNYGNIACSANVQMGTVAIGAHSTKTVSAGASESTQLYSATPLTATYLIGLSPVELGCTMEITRSYYRQVVTSAGAARRQFAWTMKNLGSATCSAERLLPQI